MRETRLSLTSPQGTPRARDVSRCWLRVRLGPRRDGSRGALTLDRPQLDGALAAVAQCQDDIDLEIIDRLARLVLHDQLGTQLP